MSDDAVASSQAVDRRIGDYELLPAAEEALRAAGWRWEDIGRIACVTGPGGFTSLRMAVAFANALAHELGVPLAGVHLADLCEARAVVNIERGTSSENPKSEIRNPSFVWLHSTKAKELFVRGGQWTEPTHVSVDQLTARSYELSTSSWCGELLPTHREIVEQWGMRSAELAPIGDVLPAFLARQSYERKSIVPWYGREG